VVEITVNRMGYVERAKVQTGDKNPPCLIEAAERAAMLSNFNSAETAPEKQRGTITYRFQAQ
jgi:hypothetical protein